MHSLTFFAGKKKENEETVEGWRVVLSFVVAPIALLLIVLLLVKWFDEITAILPLLLQLLFTFLVVVVIIGIVFLIGQGIRKYLPNLFMFLVEKVFSGGGLRVVATSSALAGVVMTTTHITTQIENQIKNGVYITLKNPHELEVDLAPIDKGMGGIANTLKDIGRKIPPSVPLDGSIEGIANTLKNIEGKIPPSAPPDGSIEGIANTLKDIERKIPPSVPPSEDIEGIRKALARLSHQLTRLNDLVAHSQEEVATSQKIDKGVGELKTYSQKLQARNIGQRAYDFFFGRSQ